MESFLTLLPLHEPAEPTARVLLAGDAEAREQEYMVSGSYAKP